MALTLIDRRAMSSGFDLPLARLREIAGDPVTYIVRVASSDAGEAI